MKAERKKSIDYRHQKSLLKNRQRRTVVWSLTFRKKKKNVFFFSFFSLAVAEKTKVWVQREGKKKK